MAMGTETGFQQKLHSALMPDYNRAAAVYWWGLIFAGAAVFAVASVSASLRPPASILQIVAVCMASMLAGAFPVPLPGTKSSFSAAEIFIFLALLYVGLDAACLAAAAEAFVASARTSKRWTSRLVSPAVAAISMGITGGLFLQVASTLQSRQFYDEGTLLGLLPAAAVVHFLLTGWLVRMVLHLKADKPLRMRVLLGSFGWIGSMYAANAFIAALLYVTARHAGAIVLLAAGPMIALLLTTVHFHFRQREAEAAEAQARIEAAEAVAAQTARHNAELRRIAEQEGLTPLVERERFLECVAEAFKPGARIHRSFAVMYVDIDRFKRISDTLGQAAGEEILVHAANRMQRRLRRCDLLGKLGRDAFAVLLRDLDSERVVDVADRLLEALSTPYAVSGVTAESSASIGIALGDFAYQAADDMLRDAKAAMARAKSLGGARHAFHHPDVLERSAAPERNALVDA
jgi:diguanylate cyclase (GGDEF)-like protein